MSNVPAPPKGLKTGGRRLWRATLGGFELAEHEQVVLKEACRTIDLLDELQALIDQDGAVLPWGEGTRAHPAAVEARQHRIALARLIASLGIPADDYSGRAPRGGARGVYRINGAA